VRLFRTSHPESSTAFRLPRDMLESIDVLCNALDLTRSQLFRRSIAEYLKAHDHRRQETIQKGEQQ
jgi:predicted transcriptional regulator